MYIYIFPLCICVQVVNTMCGQSMQEYEYVEAGNNIYTNGCIDKLVNWIHSNLFLLGGIALGLSIPQVGCNVQHTYQHMHACCAQVSKGRDSRGCRQLVVMHLSYVFSSAAGWDPSVSNFNQPDQRPDRASELQPQAPLRPVELTKARSDQILMNGTRKTPSAVGRWVKPLMPVL